MPNLLLWNFKPPSSYLSLFLIWQCYMNSMEHCSSENHFFNESSYFCSIHSLQILMNSLQKESELFWQQSKNFSFWDLYFSFSVKLLNRNAPCELSTLARLHLPSTSVFMLGIFCFCNCSQGDILGSPMVQLE